MKKKALAIIFCLLASSVTSVYAAENNKNSWYIGTKMGWSHFHFFKNYTDTSSNVVIDEFLEGKMSAPIVGLFLGHEFNPYVSLEIENNTNGFFPQMIFQKNNNPLQLNTVQISTKLAYPITDSFSLYTRLGGTFLLNNLSYDKSISHLFSKDTALVPSVSLGTEYVFKERFITRLDYNWQNNIKHVINSSIQPDFGDIVFSMAWKFGKSHVNDVFSSYDPEFFSTQYSVLNENITFPFNSSDLKPIAYDKLNKLYENIKRMKLKHAVIVLVGHSDKIGDLQVNQKLSEERAYSVKNYLTAKGFNREKIIIRGVGDLYPFTNQTCNDIVNKPLLVSCLAPDRRVDIEVLSDSE